MRHISLPFSEREELIRSVQASGVNPYSRMPVHEQEMFFGRSQELNLLRDWLRVRVGTIWLLGQKRVGKTSLLLHLKNHFLDQAEFVPVFLDFQILGTLEPVDVFFEIANAVYTELRSDSRIDELGAPLREMFEHDPLGHLVEYLLDVQSHPNVGKIVLLLDEFSRTTDAYLQGRLDECFFQQWRGLIQATLPDVKYIIAIQQQVFDSMVERVQGGQEDPSWHLIELGEKVPLRPLQDKDARHLIEWPIRNYLEFPPDALDLVYTLTGGSPFLIQAFCFKLVAHLSEMNKRQADQMDVGQVCMEFMSPDESLFAHLLDLIRGVANTLCTQMAILAEDVRAEDDRNNHDLDRELAASPLFNVMTQLFVKLIEPEAAQNWIDAYTEVYPAVSELSAELLETTGAHPYLLHSMSDVLPEVQQMLPPDNPLSAEHFPLIRLRLEELFRLRLEELWSASFCHSLAQIAKSTGAATGRGCSGGHYPNVDQSLIDEANRA